MASDDGVNWHEAEPLWSPETYFTHECPDMFRMGDWYYLIFSEFSQEKVTRYRMSRNPRGPWIAPADDRFDSTAYYAAKSCGDGKRRYLFGWLATRDGDADEGNWQWGGCLVVHEIVQNPDGTLRVTLPRSVGKTLVPLEAPKVTVLRAEGGLKCRRMGELHGLRALDAHIEVNSPKGQMGIALYADDALENGYFLRIELNRARMVLDRWPRPGNQAYEIGLARPVRPKESGRYHLRILLDGTAACAYLDNEIALSFRMYNMAHSSWGILAENTVSRFETSTISSRRDDNSV
jgi:beta-fructofuranosidase